LGGFWLVLKTGARKKERGENEPKGRMEAEAEMLFEIPGVDRGMARAECCPGEDVRGRTDPVDGCSRLRVMSPAAERRMGFVQQRNEKHRTCHEKI